MRVAVILWSLLTTSSGFAAADCSEAVVYRQDVEGATGWNQVLPVAPEDAAIADFSEFPFLELTINGETTRYTTTSGGTGIRTRAAYVPNDNNAKSFGYTMFDISEHVADDQPGHFMILDGDLYWPECQ